MKMIRMRDDGISSLKRKMMKIVSKSNKLVSL
jgi:hypothetical protein